MTDSPQQTRWLADNSDKAWTEKIYLCYSPVWMALVGLAMMSGLVQQFNEWVYNLFGLLVVLPFVLLPAYLSTENGQLHKGKKFYEMFWFKSNLYMASFVFLVLI